MMKLFRNPEVKRTLLLYCIVAAAATAAAFIMGGSFGFLMLAVCGAFIIIYIAATYRRYKRISDLAADIDRILHGDQHIDIEKYAEGELGILQSEVHKMTIRLREQQQSLMDDKIYLADAIADISHQIRTPLTSINLLVSFISESGITDERRQKLSCELYELLSRIDWLITALLKISKLDAGTAKLKAERIPLAKLLERATAPLLVTMDLRDQALRMTADGEFFGDVSWTCEAIANVAKNCMEHTPEGGMVEISASDNALYTEIDRKFLTDDVKESFDELPDREEGEEPTNESINTYVVFVDDTSFRALLKDNGLSEQKFMDAENPLAVAVDGITYFNGMAERFETVKYLKSDNCEFTVKRLGEIEGYLCYGEIEDENGNRIVRYVKNDGSDYEDGEYLDVPMDSACHEETLRTGKVIYDWPYYLNTKDGVNLLYPMSLAGSVLADYERDDNRYYFTVISDDHVESYAAIETLLADNGFNAKSLMDVVEYEEANRNTVLIIQVFSYGFIVLISLIAAANVFNTISTNISLRRREFAMLKSVGMTAKGFNRMMNYECLLYGSKALLLGLPVSCGITYLIYLSIIAGYETSFHLPWRAIGIATLSVFFVVFATMMYSMSKIKKDNPIDALKNENL